MEGFGTIIQPAGAGRTRPKLAKPMTMLKPLLEIQRVQAPNMKCDKREQQRARENERERERVRESERK
eukprot:4128441-Amphidinium_carterae.1